MTRSFVFLPLILAGALAAQSFEDEFRRGLLALSGNDLAQARHRSGVLEDAVLAGAVRARHRGGAALDHRRRRHLDRAVGRAAGRQLGQALAGALDAFGGLHMLLGVGARSGHDLNVDRRRGADCPVDRLAMCWPGHGLVLSYHCVTSGSLSARFQITTSSSLPTKPCWVFDAGAGVQPTWSADV